MNTLGTWVPAWVTALVGVVAILVQWYRAAAAQGRNEGRLEAVERRADEIEEDLRDRMSDLRARMDNQDRILLGLVEERGRNEARHEENRRLLESIDRRIAR